jgi:hypothetical protein
LKEEKVILANMKRSDQVLHLSDKDFAQLVGDPSGVVRIGLYSADDVKTPYDGHGAGWQNKRGEVTNPLCYDSG